MYPIGTRLYTRRLSQMALYGELLWEDDVKSFLAVTKQWAHGIFYQATLFQVAVTEANQKWLSPEPIDDDLIEVEVIGDDGKICDIQHHVFDFCHDVNCSPEHYRIAKIEKRTYPNDIRAPLIEWDKVELPTEESK